MSKLNTNPNLMSNEDFNNLLCKTNKGKYVKSANYEVEKFKLNTIKTNTPLFKEIMAECGVKLIWLKNLLKYYLIL